MLLFCDIPYFHLLELAKSEDTKNVIVGIPTSKTIWQVPVDVDTKSDMSTLYHTKNIIL